MDSPVYREVGLKEEEYRSIKGLLGREPNLLELGMFAALWSEHCGYKHSRPYLKMFPTEAPWVLQGPGENAGVIDLGQGEAVAFKIESHNHPSAVSPFQGAATGVGGIIRDILAMGARPVALLNSLRLGPLDNPRNRHLLENIVAGLAYYGNCAGIPSLGGEIYFEPCYQGNPLVNAMAVGLLSPGKIQRGRARTPGASLVLIGAKTGREGVQGAAFASQELGEGVMGEGATPQGDAVKGKLLMGACLELAEKGLLEAVQDLGAAGLTSAAAEMAARGGSGAEVDISQVPLKEENMTPYEIMLSESQERMLVVPQRGKEGEVLKICRRWNLSAAVVGRITPDGLLRVKEGEKILAEVPVKALTEQCPVYQVEREAPGYLKQIPQVSLASLPEPQDYREAFLKLLASPNLASREWLYRHFNWENPWVLRGPGAGPGLIKLKSQRALAVTVDGNSLYCYLDPERGGAIAVAEAARNLACVGAKPLGLTNCLNFGNPEKPETAWQFYHVILGMSQACRVLDIPVTGGNVSFYNESPQGAVYPTPIVGMVGLVEDEGKIPSPGFTAPDWVIILLGETLPELGGSEYVKVVHGMVGGLPPQLDLTKEKILQETVREMIRRGWVKWAQDCSEGGLALALAEGVLLGGWGARVELPEAVRPDAFLFGESQSRVLLAVEPVRVEEVMRLARHQGVEVNILGSTGGKNLAIWTARRALLELSFEEMERAWREALPCLMEI